MTIALIIITIIAICIAIYCNKVRITENNIIANKNNELELENQKLNIKNEVLKKEQSDLLETNNIISYNQEQERKKLIDLQESLTKTYELQKQSCEREYDSFKQNCQHNFDNFKLTIDNKIKAEEDEFNFLLENLKSAYAKEQFKLLAQYNNCNDDLEKIKNTRQAAMEAQKKEREIKEKLSFYCLQPKQTEINDIEKLNNIKPSLNNPRVLSMLIWSTYFQKPMTKLCNDVIGTGIKTGIYKITNQKTNECYIGQARDLATRWKSHAKCGLDIDRPPGNKLYKAMIDYGIWNFSWEVIEECPPNLLNEKEKFYISLYDSYNYGYNSNIGIGD